MGDIREPEKLGPPQVVVTDAVLVTPTGKKPTRAPETTPDPIMRSIIDQQIAEEIALRSE
jgi:hypothetical protein